MGRAKKRKKNRQAEQREQLAPSSSTPPELSPLSSRHAAAGAAVIVVGCLLAYLPSVPGPFLWDDVKFVAENPMIHAAAGIRDIWLSPRDYEMQFFPLTYSTFWLEWRLWGDDTRGYHVVNVLLHAANALLLWVLLRRLRLRTCFVPALLFAFHPVHVESVAWICERKNTLSMTFLLLAILSWLTFARTRSTRDLVLSVAACAAGLLSKSIVALLPILLGTWIWWRAPKARRRQLWLSLVPLALLGLAMLRVTVWVEQGHMAFEESGRTFFDATVIAGRGLWFYAAKLVLPFGLMSIYPRWSIGAGDALAWAPPLAWVALLVSAWFFRDRIGKGVFAALLIFTVAHLPTSGYFEFGYLGHSFVADHFQYVPSLAFLPLLCVGAALLLDRLPRPEITSVALTALVAVVFAVQTFLHAGAYSSRLEFWTRSFEANPTHTAAGAVGDTHLRAGRHDEAIVWLQRSLEIKDNERGHYRLGELLTQIGRTDEAIAEYEIAIRVNARRNRLAKLESGAWFNIGSIHRDRGDREACVDAWTRALAADPGSALIAEWLERAAKELERERASGRE